MLLGLFSSCAKRELLSSREVQASHCISFSCRGARVPGQASVSSCGDGLCYSAARGIFPDKGSSPCLLPWQVASYPVHHEILFFCLLYFGFFWGGGRGAGFQPLKNVKIIFSLQAVWVEIRFSQQALLKHFKATATQEGE